MLKEKWCGADEDRDGRTDHSSLADVGSRAEKDAGTVAEAARGTSANRVYGQYAQPGHKKVSTGAVTSFTTTSGITGSVAASRSSGVEKQGRCGVDGKATTFAFKDRGGALLSWSLVGAAAVSDEVPDATVRKIMATVRVYDGSSGS